MHCLKRLSYCFMCSALPMPIVARLLGFLFLMRMDDVSATETGDGFFQVLAKDELEFRVLTVGLKKGVLAQALVYIIGLCRKILYGDKFLIGPHEHLKQFDDIQPIIFLPFGTAFQPEIKVEAVYIDNNPLFLLHIPIV